MARFYSIVPAIIRWCVGRTSVRQRLSPFSPDIWQYLNCGRPNDGKSVYQVLATHPVARRMCWFGNRTSICAIAGYHPPVLPASQSTSTGSRGFWVKCRWCAVLRYLHTASTTDRIRLDIARNGAPCPIDSLYLSGRSPKA